MKFLEPILIPLGKFLWWVHSIHELDTWDSFGLEKEEVLIEKIFYGLPYSISKDLYEDSSKYAEERFDLENHQNPRVLLWYKITFIYRTVFNYYFMTR